MPAVKNNVVEGPALALLPNAIIQRPSMIMSVLSGFFSNAMNLPVKPLNAAIFPLPKLPTRMELPYSPKSRGVHTTPQGEFIQGPCWRFPISRPEGVKIKNETEAIARDIILSCAILLGIGNEESPADILNVERRKAVRNSLGFKSIVAQTHTREIRVVNLDTGFAEIRDVQEAFAVDVCCRGTLVDRAIA